MPGPGYLGPGRRIPARSRRLRGDRRNGDIIKSTHEQAARNAEIVQRRRDGESTTALAREYDVTPTRIAQLVRRHREKAGEQPNVSRRKKASQAVRPRLRKGKHGLWYCSDGVVTSAGKTPKAAYDLWMTAITPSAQPLRQLASSAPPESLAPYTGPVTVVAGTKVAPKPLVMSPAMRFTMERAGLAQKPIRGMGGQGAAGRFAS